GAVVFGHYAAALLFTFVATSRLLRGAAVADVSALIGLVLLGWLWLRARVGRLLTPARRARHVWLSVGVLCVLLGWALGTVIARGAWPQVPSLSETTAPIVGIGWREQLAGAIWVLVGLVAAFGRAAPAIGVADSIRRIVHELAPPRIAGLRRTVAITTLAAPVFPPGPATPPSAP